LLPVSNPVVLVIGAGPGVGAALARRYGAAGYDVGLVRRNPAALEELGRSLQADGVTAGWTTADVGDPASLTAAVERLAGHTERVDVLHFNPSAFRAEDPLTLTVPELLEDVAVGVGALLPAVQAARPFFRRGGRITVTGSAAADQPSPKAASLGVQKAALRNLVHSLDRTLEPEGIRAVSVTVHGILQHDDPDSPFFPGRVAEALFGAAFQDEAAWRSELPYPAPRG
jgi:NAD(P)-dependent dehydrogenase (short-subunit alcohol dehydrogenase family)